MTFDPSGDLLIIMAQIIVAVQMVLEEKFVYKHNVHPLKAVGTEGMHQQGYAEKNVHFTRGTHGHGNPEKVMEFYSLIFQARKS